MHDGVHQRVLALASALRATGVQISPAAVIDAVRGMGHIDLLSRPQLHAALAAVFVQGKSQQQSFDELFDLYFPSAQPAAEPTAGSAEANAATPKAEAASSANGSDDTADADRLARAIAEGDRQALTSLARHAVRTHGRVEAPDGAATYYRYRLDGVLDQDQLRKRLHDDGTGVAATLQRAHIDRQLQQFNAEVDRELAVRDAAQRGRDRAAQQVSRPAEQLDLLHLSDVDQQRLGDEVDALARRLAARLARGTKRRSRRPDLRRTVRRSLATGGVPFNVVYARQREQRPDLFVLCDVSSSVADFVPFSWRFLQALTHHLGARAAVTRRVLRSFVFVDQVAEITERDATQPAQVPAVLSASTGRSDYGQALSQFNTQFGDAVGPSTTVLILGDARNNHLAVDTAPLAALQRQASAVYWLNPEPVAYWDRGDSLASTFAEQITQMVEVRTLRQLADFSARVLAGPTVGSR